MWRPRLVSIGVLVGITIFAGCQKGTKKFDENCRDEGTTSVLIGPGPNPQANPNCVILHQGRGDTVYFMATDATKALTIDFATQPFQKMKPVGNGRYAINCTGSTCSSGPIDPNTPSGEYDYNQTLKDGNAPPEKADGRIIIVKP